jgi:capsular polysaccharide biosynthesis protein
MTQLKNILKPPFTYDLVTMSIYDKNFQILKLTVTEKHREIAEFIINALTEKYERECENLLEKKNESIK